MHGPVEVAACRTHQPPSAAVVTLVVAVPAMFGATLQGIVVPSLHPGSARKHPWMPALPGAQAAADLPVPLASETCPRLMPVCGRCGGSWMVL